MPYLLESPAAPIIKTKSQHEHFLLTRGELKYYLTNLFQAMKPEGVEELKLDKLPLIEDASANWRLSVNTTWSQNSR